MGVKKEKPLRPAISDLLVALHGVMNQGCLLVSVLETVLQHGSIDGRVKDMVVERTKAFREALYGSED